MRLITNGKGNNVAYSYLMKACIKSPETSLVAKTYKGTWSNSLLTLCETRLAVKDKKAVQRLVGEFHRFKIHSNKTETSLWTA